MPEVLIDLQNVGRRYASGEGTVHALRGVNIRIARGEMVAIIGQSGSGKSTLMNILGCLDRPTSGSYRIADREMSSLDPDELAALRREHFGFIFQRYHLLGELTATENAEVPAVYAGLGPAARRRKAEALLQRLGQPHQSPAGATLGRPAAAGLDCTRACQQSGRDPGRRADRSARPCQRRRGAAHSRRDQCLRAHGHHRHA
jgi:ABC-type multidrug transport system ATPase subunit